jgi:SAM-dependent methyltransferase
VLRVAEQSEADAVIERYRRRDVGDLYSPLRSEVLLALQERERTIVQLLRRYASRPLDQMRLIEIGCGSGENLLALIRLGFSPELMCGNELLSERLAAAKRNLPSTINLLSGDAATLCLEEASVDIVYVSLVFSSLLSDDFQDRLAKHIWRWLRPGGGILWYDFLYDNPGNRDVRGVTRGRLRELFPHATIDARKVTLAPPIARRVVRVNASLYSFLNVFTILRTHVVCWIAK